MNQKPDVLIHNIRLLEAILFIAERPVSIEEIKQALFLTDENQVTELFSLLEQNLKDRNSFIEIFKSEEGQSIEMRINDAIKKELDAFQTKKTLSKELMKTLAYIALEQPLKYNELKKVMGHKTKEQVDALEKEGLIKVEPSGKTFLLTTTLYFATVFNLDPNHIKETFKEEITKRIEYLVDK